MAFAGRATGPSSSSGKNSSGSTSEHAADPDHLDGARTTWSDTDSRDSSGVMWRLLTVVWI
jgi:hypothetical protein